MSPKWMLPMKRAAALFLWTMILATCGTAPSDLPQEIGTGPARSSGILRVTRGDRDLKRPREAPPGKTLLYQLALPFQVSESQAALFVNIREAHAKGTDFEAGDDIVLFDDLSRISGEEAIAVTRNHQEPNPNSEPPGKLSVMVKYQVRGGFVPLGGKGENGSEHPHAGTGFGLNLAIAWPLDDPGPPPYSVLRYRGSESYRYFELHHLSYDGESLRVLESQRRGGDELLDGWTFVNGALRNGIAEGEDLLVGMVGGREGAVGSGVMRWRWEEGIWRPASYVPVTADDGSFEPSLVRDLDGNILFAARRRRGLSSQEPAGTPTPQHDIRVWRSVDGGETWTKVIHVGGVVSEAPITLNQAVDGTPYIVASQYQVFTDPTDRIKVRRDEQGRVLLGGRSRNRLVIWPLNEDRDGLEPPILVRDLREDWGPPPGRSAWRLDHANAMTVRLADGKWHDVLGLRVLEVGEITHALDPTPRTGCYLEEVISAGKPAPPWSF